MRLAPPEPALSAQALEIARRENMPPTSRSVTEGKTNGPPAAVALEGLGRGDGISPAQLTDLLHALQAVRVGDFSVRMPGDQLGIVGKIADTFNDIVTANQRMAKQLE